MSRSKSLLSSQKSETDPVVTLTEFPLQKYCSKKSLEIELVIPRTCDDQQLLNEIISTGKRFEKITNVYFISYNAVLNIKEKLINCNESELQLPKIIKECGKKLLLLEENLKTKFLALMTKIKILEILYLDYIAKIDKAQKSKDIDTKLAELLKDCEETKPSTKGAKKGKAVKKTKSETSKKSKIAEKIPSKSSVPLVKDYSQIKLEEEEIISDINIDNQLIYIVVTDFPNPLMIRELVEIGVKVSSIIDVGLSESEDSKTTDFVLKLEELYHTPKTTKFLENTAWLKYRTDGKTNPKETFEEFLFVAKRINYIKRHHLAYIRSLRLYDFDNDPKKIDVENLDKYNRTIDCYPSEVINIPLILNAIIKEVCWREASPIYSLSDLTQSSDSHTQIFKRYQVHEEDLLKIGLKTFDEGVQYYKDTLDKLQLLAPLKELEPDERNIKTVSISTEDYCTCIDFASFYDLFHLAMFSQMKPKRFKPHHFDDFFYTENLVTFDENKEFDRVLKGNQDLTDSDDYHFGNYHVKEDLSKVVLLQMILKSLQNYSDWDSKICNESGATVLKFSDNLNSIGIDVRLWSENINTPVCLRDFCRFIAPREQFWLEQNQLEEHSSLLREAIEECEGLKFIPKALYQEYEHLLTPGKNEDIDKQVQFQNIVNEILMYPQSEDLINFCNENGTQLAYDLGPKLCQLTGHTIIFRSNDGVKVTIDTTRFFTQDFKCCIMIDANNNNLVFHQNGGFRFLLPDETIINFFKPVDAVQSKFCEKPKEEDMLIEKQMDHIEVIDQNEEHWIEFLPKHKLSSVIPNFFKRRNSLNKNVKLDDENLDKLLELLKIALTSKSPIYKISEKRSVFTLKRNNSTSSMPLLGILNKVMFKQQKRKRPRSFSIYNINTNKTKASMEYDFTVTLPNGELITTHSEGNKIVQIKQEYKYKNYKEKYRIFYSSGSVLIKHTDGTTTILRSNGDIIKLVDDSICSTLKCNFLSSQNEEDKDDFHISRCINSSRTGIKNYSNYFYDCGDVPYSHQILLTFFGKKIEVVNNRATEKQEYFVTTEHDYHTDEIFMEREDGMKFLLDKTGTQTYQFPDGTKIISFPEFEKELIHVSTSTKIDGWVSVVISYTFEHSSFLKVKFAQNDQAMIYLKDGVLSKGLFDFQLALKNNINLNVNANDISFIKRCKFCKTNCLCKIYLQNKSKLLELWDSYNKYFYSDLLGNCEINSDFINNVTNKENCNHVSRNEKYKMFVLNKKGPAGTVFWCDGLVEDKISEASNCRRTNVYNYVNNITQKQTIEIFTDVVQDFKERFTMSVCHQQNLCLAKRKHLQSKDATIHYVTYRILTLFQDLVNQTETVTELKDFLNNQDENLQSDLLQGMKNLLHYISFGDPQQEKLSYRVGIQEKNSLTISVTEKEEEVVLTVEQIIEKWKKTCKKYKTLIRDKSFPCYFQSDYYQNVIAKNNK